MAQSVEYIIITLANHTTEELAAIDEACVTKIKYSRYNTDRTKCIMKSNSPTILLNHTSYNFREISKIVLREEWLDEDV